MATELVQRLNAIEVFSGWLKTVAPECRVSNISVSKDAYGRDFPDFALSENGNPVGRFRSPAAALIALGREELTDAYLLYIIENQRRQPQAKAVGVK